MWEDPIVAEVRRARERLTAESGGSVKAVFAELRKRQAALGDRLVRVRADTDRVQRAPVAASIAEPAAAG